MATSVKLSRMTIDLPVNDHKKLKAIAAVLGKSMREVVLEAVEQFLIKSNKLPHDVKVLTKGFDPLRRDVR